MSNEVTIRDGKMTPLTIADIKEQVALIHQLLKEIMEEGQHYGTIPGCGDKLTLLKPGAEKIGFTFRLVPKYEITVHDFINGHREYEVICSLYHIKTGEFWGQGVGICSTMESKYRYRTGPIEPTGQPVPKEYWDIRKTESARAQELIGGKGYQVKKINDIWQIVRQGEKIENDNPADCFNIVKKMAKKRAHVDAVLTATAASDIFTQDMEDIEEDVVDITAASAQEVKRKSDTINPPSNGLTIKDIKVNTGETKGKKWTKYEITDSLGVIHSTFSKTYYEIAQKALHERLPVVINSIEGKYGYELQVITIGMEAGYVAQAGEWTKDKIIGILSSADSLDILEDLWKSLTTHIAKLDGSERVACQVAKDKRGVELSHA